MTAEEIKQLQSLDFPLYDGYVLHKFPCVLKDPSKHMEAVLNFDSKDSDILMCTYPKTGSCWVNEIVLMLLGGKTEYSTRAKAPTMLDYIDPTTLKNMKPPRFLNVHYPFRHIPKKHVQNGNKIIRILRNPKDVMVSEYNHYIRDPFACTDDFPGTWNDFFNDKMKLVHNFYGGFLEYQKEWENAIRTGQVKNVHTLFYEDLSKDPVMEIRRLAIFLKVPHTEELLNQIADKCSFKKLLNAYKEIKDVGPQMEMISRDGTNFLFHKGKVGEWKNWFTVAQNEAYDKLLEKELENSELKFTYE